YGPVTVPLLDLCSANSGSHHLRPTLNNILQVEIDALNAAGGLLGAQIQLVTADDGYDMTRTPEVVKQLLSDSAVKLMVGPSFAGLYLGAKPLIEKVQVPNCVTAM